MLKNMCNMFSFEIYSLTTKRKDGKKVIGNGNKSRMSIPMKVLFLWTILAEEKRKYRLGIYFFIFFERI